MSHLASLAGLLWRQLLRQGKRTAALMAQLCLGALLGLPGVLLALPLVVVLQVLCQEVLVRDVMDHWDRQAS